MQLVQSADAVALSGLTLHQLKEWCGRRAVVVPDVPGAGRGRHALYSWRTLLALRLLKQLHDNFGIEVGAWAEAIQRCQTLLEGQSFLTLWGAWIVFPSNREARITTDRDIGSGQPHVALSLDSHLEVLAAGLSLPGAPDQLPLFPAMVVRR
jgi:hypothetical protein